MKLSIDTRYDWLITKVDNSAEQALVLNAPITEVCRGAESVDVYVYVGRFRKPEPTLGLVPQGYVTFETEEVTDDQG